MVEMIMWNNKQYAIIGFDLLTELSSNLRLIVLMKQQKTLI